MNIIYISPRDLNKARVDPIMMMETCAALSRDGNNVLIIAPRMPMKEETSKELFWKHYNLPDNLFKVVHLYGIANDYSSQIVRNISKIISHSIYSLKVLFDVLKSKDKYVIISRCFVGSLPYIFMNYFLPKRKKLILAYELHFITIRKFELGILKHFDIFFCISENLVVKAKNIFQKQKNNVYISRLGVDLDRFDVAENKEELMNYYGFDNHLILAVYTGKIYKGQKEIEYYLDAAKRNKEILFLMIGGMKEVVEYWTEIAGKNNLRNIIFTGFKNPAEIPVIQKSADLLLMYYTNDVPTLDYMCPGKMAEYLASGKTIIASDYPVLREVLVNENNCLLVRPENIEDFSKCLKNASANMELREKIGEHAKITATNLSWNERGKKMSMILANYN